MEYFIVINLNYVYIKGGKRRKKETRGGIRNTGDGLKLPAGWPSIRSEKIEMKGPREGREGAPQVSRDLPGRQKEQKARCSNRFSQQGTTR